MAGSADVSLFGDGDDGDDGDAGTTSGGTVGPTISIETGASSIAVDTETLEFWLLAAQTVTLAYVAYKEVGR